MYTRLYPGCRHQGVDASELYADEGVKRKVDYSSIDEVVNYYKKDAKVVSPSNLNLIEI